MGLVINGGDWVQAKATKEEMSIEEILEKLPTEVMTEECLLEICYVLICLRKAKNDGLTPGGYARRVFPERSPDSAKRAIYAMLGTTITGKPQRIPYGQAFLMAEALSKSFTDLTYDAVHMMRDLSIVKSPQQ